MTLDTEPEHDPLNPVDAETYLAALLVSLTRSALREEALTAVHPDEFASPHIAALWAAARGLRDDNERITARALVGRIEHGTAVAERILTRVAGHVPPAADYGRVVAEVKRCARTRAIIQAANEIAHRARVAEDPEQALTFAAERLANLDQTGAAPDVLEWSTLLDDWHHAVTNPADDTHWIIPTPWDDINDVIAGGVHGGRMYVIGARPGEGKSIAAHRIAYHAASMGHAAIVFSVEMGAHEVTGRMVAGSADVEMGEISRRQLTAHSLSKVDRLVDQVRHYPLYVVDKSDITVAYIKSVCRAQKRRTGLQVIVVDYLQLVTAERGKPREQQVAEISRQLKILSRELDCAVIVPAQLNRESVKRGNNKPNLSDLRESGGIEADADVVLLLARQVITADEDKALAGTFNDTLLVEIAKNRHGPVCGRELLWRGHYATLG